MIAFLDTNVVLDVLLERRPFYADSARVWTLAERGRIQGVVSAVSLTTVYYLVHRWSSRGTALETVRKLRSCMRFSPCDAPVLNQAIDADFPDFEDAVQYFSARAALADVLITRDVRDFPPADPPAMAPADFLAAHPLET